MTTPQFTAAELGGFMLEYLDALAAFNKLGPAANIDEATAVFRAANLVQVRAHKAGIADAKRKEHGRVMMDAHATMKDFERERDDAPRYSEEEYQALIDLTDAGNANLLIELAGGDLRHVHETKQWLRWDGRRWHVDTHEAFATQCALQVAAHYMDHAKHSALRGEWMKHPDGTQIGAQELFDWAEKSRSRNALNAMLDLARKMPGVAISTNELDRNPCLLGVENGVVDLRDATLRDDSREDFITKRCPVKYNPVAQAPRWRGLINEATGSPLPVEYDAAGQIKPETIGRYTPRPSLADYLHKHLGYNTTGETREQKLFVESGEGSNGKGAIFDTTKDILGPYAVTIPAAALMSTKYDADAERPTALAATLAGARFVVASESKEGQTLNVAMIKAHTGDKQMTARKMRENPFTFDITHKLNLLTNHRPALDHLDAAIKGRLHLIPFDRRWNRPGEVDRDAALPDGDATLTATLKAEAEGILAWLVEGARRYYVEGLTPPAEVVAKTREYVAEQDHLGQWLTTMQRCPARSGLRASELFAQFSAWCTADGRVVQPSNQNAFSRGLRGRGVEAFEGIRGNHWGLMMAGASTPTPPQPPVRFT